MKSFKKLFLAVAAFAVFVIGSGYAANAETGDLVKALPASDGVFTADLRKILSESLPTLFRSNPEKLANAKEWIEDVKTKTGIDLSKFDEVVGGFKSKTLENGETEMEPVVLARGTFDNAKLEPAIKVASKGSYKKINYKGKTIYVFSPKAVFEKTTKATTKEDSFLVKTAKSIFRSVYEEVAITALSNDVVAMGTLSRVKETIDPGARIDASTLALLDQGTDPVMRFGANLPGGLSSIIKLDSDELGKALDAIKQLKGALSITGEESVLNISAGTDDEQSSKMLFIQLSSVKQVGSILLSGSAGGNKQIYSNIIDNTVIRRNANNVLIDVNVPQSDIDVLLAKK
ncbi:MAG: hypothetical protein ACK5NT_14480 [Pyrinomonadaceae bacterium]